MNIDLVLLLLRLAVIGLLYLFLARVVAALWSDLRRAREASDPWSIGSDMGDLGHAALVVVAPAESGHAPGVTFPLHERTPIGRTEANSIVLPDDFVSSEHALITRRNGNWWIQDLGSTNGTMLNGRRVTAVTKLVVGDSVEIGRVQFRVTD